MHGRPRQVKGLPVDPEKVKAKEKKLQQFRQLTNAVLHKVQTKQYDPDSLAMAALLLQKNPDVYTIWNYRRQALAGALEGAEGAEKARQTAAAELKVTEAALLENPKSYSAWYHRLWIMRKGLTSLQDELKNVNRFLEMDSRNFQAWHYRREIVKLSGTAAEEELEYARSLIDNDFSNYSAWHARSSLLTDMHAAQQVVPLQDLLADAKPAAAVSIPAEELEQEYDLAQQAFFTDPEDQSAYMYHRWLLKTSLMHYQAKAGKESMDHAKQVFAAVLKREEARCRELLEVEPDRSKCKWPLLTLAHILGLQRSICLQLEDRAEEESLYAELADIDPMRRGYYRDAAHLQLLQ